MSWLLAALFLLPPLLAGEPMTVEQCATRFGFSNHVNNDHLAEITGTTIGTFYETVLSAVGKSGTLYFDTDTGPRQIWVYFYLGQEYWFFPRHRDDPGAGLDHGHWHGSCMLLRG